MSRIYYNIHKLDINEINMVLSQISTKIGEILTDVDNLSTTSIDDDLTITVAGKGVVLTNAAGTITKRLRLNDAGDDIIIEDL